MREQVRLGAWGVPLAAVPAAAGLFVLVMWPLHGYWSEDAGWAWWLWLVAIRYIGPLFAAVAGWCVASRLREGRQGWLATTRRGGVYLWSAVWPTVCVATAVSIVSAGVLLAISGSLVGTWRWAPAAFATGLVTQAACIAIGAAVCRWWHSPLSGPVVGIALFCLTLGVADPLGLGDWLAVGGPVASLAGYEPDPGVLGTRLAVAALLVVLCALALTPRALVRGRRLAILAVVVVTVTVAYAFPAFRSGGDYRADAAASADTCSLAGGTRACVLPENERYVALLATALDRVSIAASQLDHDLPGEFRQYLPVDLNAIWSGRAEEPRNGRVLLEYGMGWQDPAAVVFHAVHSLFTPPACNAVQPDEEATERLLDVTPVVTRWLAQNSGLPSESLDIDWTSSDPAVQRFDALSPAQQTRYLQDALPALAQCRFQDLPAL